MGLNFDCNPVGFVYFTFAIGIILFLITLYVCGLTIQKFCFVKDNSIKQGLKYLSIISEILCVCGVGTFFFTNFWKQECTQGGQESVGYYIATVIVFITYPVALTFLFLIFAYRIYLTFVKAALYHLSKLQTRLLIGMLVIMVINNIIGIYFAGQPPPPGLQKALIFLNLSFIFSLFSSILLLYIFYKKMQNLSQLVSNKKETLGSSNSQLSLGTSPTQNEPSNNSNNIGNSQALQVGNTSPGASPRSESKEVSFPSDGGSPRPAANGNVNGKVSEPSELSISMSNDSKFNEKQIKLINVTAKLSVLVFIAMISTVCGLLINMINAIFDRPYYYGTFVILYCAFDITVNSVCLLLHWPFAKHIYHKFCMPCHNVMLARCSKKFLKYIEKRQKSVNVSEMDL